MNQFKLVVIILCLTLVVLAIPSGVKADAWNKKTIVTFSQPVEIPGVGAQVLPAGTYVFKLLDSLSDRNIVQIFNQDQTHVFATILAIPNYRLQATDKTVMTFRERPAGTPEAIRAWFYPGANWGQEFVYPKKRAIELAKLTHEPVLAMPAELASYITTPVKAADEPPVSARRYRRKLMATQFRDERAAHCERTPFRARTRGRSRTRDACQPVPERDPGD